MTKQELEIRSWLSPAQVRDFDDMYHCRVLGAGNNIRMIGGMYADLAATAAERGLSSEELVSRVEALSQYFIVKRGASSYAIVAAVRLMTGGFSRRKHDPLEQVCAALSGAYLTYRDRAEHWTEQIRGYLRELTVPMSRVFLFDYSGTVNLVLEVAAEQHKTLELYVPESRILDGGHAYVRNGVALGHRVHYFPDAAIAHFVRQSDAAFIGAETFFPNGNAANTVGSDLTALACHYYGKPLYVPTQLIKVDPRSFDDPGEKTLCEDASAYFGLQLEEELRAAADLTTAGLVTVPAELVTAFVTEEGVIPPSELRRVSQAFVDNMR